MKETLELTTPRLVLRPVRKEDFEGWAEMMGDPESMARLGGPKSRFLAWHMFRSIAGSWDLDGFSIFSVLEKNTRRWIGYAGVHQPDGWPAPEGLCGIARAAWRYGYGTEALGAAVDWAFDYLGCDEIIYYIPPGHVKSERIAQKLGAQLRGSTRLPTFEDDEFPVTIWGQTREERRWVRSPAPSVSARASI